MNKTLSFIRLDFITIKPYLTFKNLIIFFIVSIFVTASTGTNTMGISMLMVFGAIYVSYPFAICEKSGIDALYATLSIKRNTVVMGRYLFSIILDICAGFIAYGLSFAILTVMQKEFNAVESLIVTLVMFIVYSIIQAIQLPIYFKFGYSKAKFWAYLPFVGWPLAVMGISNLLGKGGLTNSLSVFFEWLAANPFIAFALIAVIWFAIMVISYIISFAYYNKRDF